jgi:hypothetical protein
MAHKLLNLRKCAKTKNDGFKKFEATLGDPPNKF